MFVGLSEISASVVVLKCETCWNYQSNFSVPRGCKKLLRFARGSGTQSDTVNTKLEKVNFKRHS